MRHPNIIATRTTIVPFVYIVLFVLQCERDRSTLTIHIEGIWQLPLVIGPVPINQKCCLGRGGTEKVALRTPSRLVMEDGTLQLTKANKTTIFGLGATCVAYRETRG